jgi:hypothetical protein
VRFVSFLLAEPARSIISHTARQLMMIRHRPVRNGMFLNVLVVLLSARAQRTTGTVFLTLDRPDLVPAHPTSPPMTHGALSTYNVLYLRTTGARTCAMRGRVHAAPALRAPTWVCAFVY